MKIKRRGNTLEIKFDSHEESVSFLKQAGFKNLPPGPKKQAVEQSDRADATLGIWLHCMTCGDWHHERDSCIRPNRVRRSS